MAKEHFDEHFVVSIDVGSSKIVILLANEKNGRLEIFGHARGESVGVHKGEIVDVDEVAKAIKRVKDDAILSCNTNFHSVVANISDAKLIVNNRESETHVSEKVSKKDVEHVIKIAQSVVIPDSHKIINSVIHHYTLDENTSTHQGDELIGEKARNLKISMHVAAAPSQSVKRIQRSLDQNKLGFSDVVPNSMASSEPYLTENEKERGVCLVDIGSEVMGLSVFKGGGIVYSVVIQAGAKQVTRDIADAFNTSFEEAERLKIKYGCAQAKTLVEDKLIQFRQADDSSDYYLSQHSLIEVIEVAYSELFSLIRKKLKTKELYRPLNSGFILVGGGAKIKGCNDLMFSHFRKRVKIGIVNTDLIRVDTNSISSNYDLLAPEYSCALGLLLFDNDKSIVKAQQSSNGKGILGKIKQTMLEY
ncbi:MAG: Cell division protein FtsA [Catillopecten margaritatus gill symbiont]|uniref:Cell division protein FtsA n=1 Tax=Catillopecten margaritatus gill symbiont TaxID=3083288 RepID=A0AAU6PG55_9GAMM